MHSRGDVLYGAAQPLESNTPESRGSQNSGTDCQAKTATQVCVLSHQNAEPLLAEAQRIPAAAASLDLDVTGQVRQVCGRIRDVLVSAAAAVEHDACAIWHCGAQPVQVGQCVAGLQCWDDALQP